MKPTNINAINATTVIGGAQSRMLADQQQQQQQREKQQLLILQGLFVTSMARRCEEYNVLDYVTAALDISNGIGTESTALVETKPQLQ
ncbi:hypothetical protein IV203_022616 [Nitzschia inconspicua]|uniref:Uncharacterized protein n=1 Tax=Nitzschia inconspicua TaxID=303405 RepID=A0A9K3PEM6_9STRA|nr:hypothetical protein IV203_022616 [Nitzschia inconspicua]